MQNGFCLYWGACFLLITSLSFAQEQQSPDSINRLRALGLAYMEEEKFPEAIEVYQKAASMETASASDVINLGIAYYHGDHNDQSMDYLHEGLQRDSDNLYAHYTLGLAYKKIGDSTQAMQSFRRVVEQDDTDPASLYNLGLALSQLKQLEKAARWFQQTIEHDPEHSSAYYQLLLYYSRNQQMDKALEMQKKFRQLKQNEEQRPPNAVDEGKFLGPIEFDLPPHEHPNWTSDLRPAFEPASSWQQAFNASLGREIDSCLLLLSHPEVQQTTAIVRTKDNDILHCTIDAKGEIQTSQSLPLAHSTWSGCTVADYDNDGLQDFFIYHEDTETSPSAALLRQKEDGSFEDVTSSAGIDTSGVAHAFWADIDHEGDLDLLLARPHSHDQVFQNNGDGTFSHITDQLPGFDSLASRSILASDLDNDNDLDLIRWLSHGKIVFYSNERDEGFIKRFTIQEELTASTPSSRLLSRDLDNDRFMELIVLGAQGENSRVWSIGKNWKVRPFTELSLESSAIITCVFDANNDGYDDFAVIDPSLGFRIAWSRSPMPAEYGEPLQNPPQPLFPVDLDFDGDLDLVGHTDQGITPFLNQGGNQNHWLQVSINGQKNAADGYGSKIWIKHDLFRAKKEITTPYTHIGLGERSTIDVVRITWPNGIFQNLIHQPANEVLSVDEKPGYVGSCPFVYSWNGEEFEFVADSLCTGPLGLYVGGGYFPPRPEEYIRIRGDQLKAKEDALELRIREELREIVYLDQLELFSVVHPKSVKVFLTEKFTIPPFPKFGLIGMSSYARPPKRVMDSWNRDVTSLIAENDHRYPRPWGESRYEGVGEKHYFEIDLNDTADAENVYLFMTGYVDWPNSSTALALEQNPSLDFIMPYLQVKDKNGEWRTVMDCMGFPAGKLKTIALDVSDLFLTQDRTLRIVSTLQVHWDQILVDTNPILEGFQIRKHPRLSSDLRYAGYSEGYDLDDRGPHWYDYDHRRTNARWDYQLGAFTRYGDVDPLLEKFDDQYAIMQHGDEVAAHFQALDHPADKHVTYILHLMGWVKDADYNTAFGSTVEPLPFKEMSAYPYGPDESYPYTQEHVEYLLQYNTRFMTRQNEPLAIPQPIESPPSGDSSHP